MKRIITLFLLSFSVLAADWYTPSGAPTPNSVASSAVIRGEYSAIGAAFAKLPPLSGYSNNIVGVNSTGTALVSYTGAQVLTAISAQPLSSSLSALAAITPSTLGLALTANTTAAQDLTALGISSLAQGALTQTTSAGVQTALGFGSATLWNIGSSANNIPQLNSSAQLPAVDGSLLTGLNKPSVRQTVLTGPHDTNGTATFGGSTGSTTVTATGTLLVTAAQGYTGQTDLTCSINNPSWTGLSTNGTMSLFIGISGGTCSPISSTLSGVYVNGATPSSANNQFTFDYGAMTGYLGNGSTYNNAAIVEVGSVYVSGGVVSTITWFALKGHADSGWLSQLPPVNNYAGVSHFIATEPSTLKASLVLKNTTTNGGWPVGSIISNIYTDNGTAWVPLTLQLTSTAVNFYTGATVAFGALNASTGVHATLLAADWSYRVIVDRGW